MFSLISFVKQYVLEPFLNKFEKYIWNPMVKYYKITIPAVLLSPLIVKGAISLF